MVAQEGFQDDVSETSVARTSGLQLLGVTRNARLPYLCFAFDCSSPFMPFHFGEAWGSQTYPEPPE